MPCLFVFLAAVCPLCSLRPVDLQSPVSRPDHGRTSVIRHELAQTTVGMDEFRQQQLEMLTRPRPSSPSSTPSAANAASALHLGEHPGTSKTGLASWSYATHKLSLSLFLSCLLSLALSRLLARAVPYKHTQTHAQCHCPRRRVEPCPLRREKQDLRCNQEPVPTAPTTSHLYSRSKLRACMPSACVCVCVCLCLCLCLWACFCLSVCLSVKDREARTERRRDTSSIF